jgi:hypothetical protein
MSASLLSVYRGEDGVAEDSSSKNRGSKAKTECGETGRFKLHHPKHLDRPLSSHIKILGQPLKKSQSGRKNH